MQKNLLIYKLLDFGAVEIAVVDLIIPHPVKTIQHNASVETLDKRVC